MHSKERQETQGVNSKYEYVIDQNYSSPPMRIRSMYDYHEDRSAVIDLFRRCETTNQTSALMSIGHAAASASFHCEFTDYLWCMEQYPESYCLQLVEPTDGRIISACVYNIKQVHYGEHIMTVIFARLGRVEPDRRRQHLISNLLSQAERIYHRNGVDFSQAYTLTANMASLAFQRTFYKSRVKEISLLDILILPTTLDTAARPLLELNHAETERLWTIDLVNWVCQPVLSDLRRIMTMNEYKGTFIVGDFSSGRYSATSVWQSSNAILCDDRCGLKNPYRGPYWLAFNFFQSPSSESNSVDEKVTLLSSLSNAAANNNIPFILCHVEQSSLFNPLCRKRAVAITTELLTRRVVSQRMAELGDMLDKSPVWLDPRDFSGLLYFSLLTEKMNSQL